MDAPPPPPHIPSRRWRHHPRLLHPQQTQFCLFSYELLLWPRSKGQKTESSKLDCKREMTQREGPRTWRRTNSFSPRLTAQIAGESPLRWRTVTAKISTSPSPEELVRHSSYDSSACPKSSPLPLKSFPALSPLFFPSIFSLFSFLPHYWQNN